MTQSKFDKKYYLGGVYVNYDTFLNWREIAKDLIGRFKFSSFLDVGCGCGNLVKEIKKQLKIKGGKNYNIQGIDISDFAVKRANVPFVSLADCKNLPFEDKSFDMVYILGTFSYLSNFSEIKRAMEEAYRVAKKLLVFEDVYIVPDKQSDDYDPYRKHIFNGKKWMFLWKDIISKNDIIETYKDEIIIRKA